MVQRRGTDLGIGWDGMGVKVRIRQVAMELIVDQEDDAGKLINRIKTQPLFIWEGEFDKPVREWVDKAEAQLSAPIPPPEPQASKRKK